MRSLMDIRRSVATRIWSDSYILGLQAEAKLLFIYLLTNSKTNLAGVYELPIAYMEFETGISRDRLLKILHQFGEDEKVIYEEGYVIIQNFAKHQKFNKNMEVNVKKIFKELPDCIKRSKSLSKPLEAFQRLRKIEIEIEIEIEKGNRNRKRNRKIVSEKALTPSNDLVTILINKWTELYLESRDTEYITSGKDRAAVGSLLGKYKKANPENDTNNCINDFSLLFTSALSITDDWLYKNMTLSILNSKINEVKNYVRNSKKESVEEFARRVSEGF